MKKALIITSIIAMLIFSSCFGKGISDIGIEQDQIVFELSIKADWNDVKDAEGYLIELSAMENFKEVFYTETVEDSEATLGSGSPQDIALSKGDYYIRIKPLIKGTKLGSWSDTVFFHYYPLTLSIIEPGNETHFQQNQPFLVTYTSATLGSGSTRIQVSNDRSFSRLFFDEEVDAGTEQSLEIPALEAGQYYIRGAFTGDGKEKELYSPVREINMENPVLWANVNYDESLRSRSSIVQILSNGEIISDKGFPHNNGFTSKQIEVDGKRFLWLDSFNEEFILMIQTESGLLKEITLDKIQEGNWRGLDSGNNYIYLSGSRTTENGQQVCILQLNQRGSRLREIFLDPIVEWPEEASGNEIAVDVQVINDSLLIAGNSRGESGETAIWIAQAKMDGEILGKALYTSPDGNQNLSIRDFICKTEKGFLYLGVTYDTEIRDWKPVLFHFNPDEGSIGKIDLLTRGSYSGDTLWIEDTSTLIVAWGSFLYKYTINTDATELDPLAIKEISLSDNGSDSKLEIFLKDLQLSNGQIIVSGSSNNIPIFTSSWIAGLSKSLNSITWQIPEARSDELVIKDYNINFMKYGEDWAPWKTNARGDEGTYEYDLVYKPDGQQMGLIRPIDGPEKVFGEILDQHPPIREGSDRFKIWEVEGVYLIGNESHAYLNIITNPDWELRNGLHVGMNSGDASRIMSGFKPFSDEVEGWISAPDFTEILPYYTDLEGYYNAEGPGGIAVLLFFAEGELVAFALEAML